MLRQITTVLYAEGKTDYKFLPEVIERELSYALGELDEEYDLFPILYLDNNPTGTFEERMLYIESLYNAQDIFLFIKIVTAGVSWLS